MNNVSVTRPYTKRRQYTPEFKAQLVAECQRPDTSVSRVALDNNLNANLLRRWISESKQTGKSPSPAFVPISLPAATSAVEKRSTIRIEIPSAWVSEVLAITPASFHDDGYDFGVVLKTLKQGAGRPSKRSLQRSPKRFIPILDRDFQTRIQSYLWMGKFRKDERKH